MLTQSEVAKALGVSRPTITEIEIRALEKCRFAAAMKDVFPLRPGETFTVWINRLRAVLLSSQTATATPPHKLKKHHGNVQANRNS
jgi:DNA-binding XRE family transcriptional regulator